MTNNKLTVGILAHVDAGKTTLSESILYVSGSIRKLGRVDHKDAFLDTHQIEKERGITIFSKQANFSWQDKQITLLDTPGHVDFSAEMERTLQVLDYAILVISATAGVQSHVITLWRLLRIYKVPTFIFVNKMDQMGGAREKVMQEIKERLGDECVDFSCTDSEIFYEEIATSDEEVLEEYLNTGGVSEVEIQNLIQSRRIFPCYFGSALKVEGIECFLNDLVVRMKEISYPEEFGARVYKISRDKQGNRQTHMKVTGGVLYPKMLIGEEKVNQVRIYSGNEFDSVTEAVAGSICVVTGLSDTIAGSGIGCEQEIHGSILEPIMEYRMNIPEGGNPFEVYQRVKHMEEEEPQLHLTWNEATNEIHATIMGEVQLEVIKRLIREQMDLEVEFGAGSIVYKETIAETVVGVGHYEPLRHYAEAHILIEPMERGTGVLYEMDCDDEQLAPNWQRLILSHLAERVHVGVLTGSELTDIKFTVVAGRAHLKHTEGGDFRQATYRAVRQGLMKVRSILLEPMYEFRIEVPAECIGRAMTDIQKMKGTFDSPITEGELVVLQGTAPVANMQGYPLEVAAYTKGKGVIACELKGYEICHNQEQVIDRCCYDPTGDIANPTGSIFCSQGSGFYVTWDQVDNYKHVKSNVDLGEQEAEEEKGHYTQAHRKVFYQEPETFQAVSLHGLADKELEDIFVRTYGEITHKKAPKTKRHVSYNVSQHSRSNISKNKDRYLLVDGYNIIFAWDELRSIAEENLDGARVRLQDILCNYQGYRNITVIVVFDAYKVKGKQREVMEYNNIFVVFTKEAETADQYIEKTVHKMGREHEVTVATSDALEQVIIFGQGASRMSAGGLKEEIERVEKEIGDYLS